MHIASHAYIEPRDNASRFESSKKEPSLKITKTGGNENIKQTLSEGCLESLLATKGKYARTRILAAGPDRRAVLAYSQEKQRVEGFVMNKDQQLVPIKPYDMPKELREILNSDAFEAFLKDVHARTIELSNGDFRLGLHQGLKGGVYREDGDVDKIKKELEILSADSWNGRHESRVIIQNTCGYPISIKNKGAISGNFLNQYPEKAFSQDNTIPDGAAGGIFYDSTLGTPAGTKGYISVEIKTQKGDFLVVCAFSTGFLPGTKNAARILIRPIDASGNIGGHGIDSTGKITNTSDYFSTGTYHTGGNINTECFQPSSMFDVYCEFDNNSKAYFTFMFKKKPFKPGPPDPIPNPIPNIDLINIQQQVYQLSHGMKGIRYDIEEIQDKQITMDKTLNEVIIQNQAVIMKAEAAIASNQKAMQEMFNENQQVMHNERVAMEDALKNNQKVMGSVIDNNQKMMNAMMQQMFKQFEQLNDKQ